MHFHRLQGIFLVGIKIESINFHRPSLFHQNFFMLLCKTCAIDMSSLKTTWLDLTITAVGMLFCTSLAKFYPDRTTHGRKITSFRSSRWWISAILDFRGPMMGSLKISRTTSYRSSIETTVLNCLVFEKIAFLHFGVRQTNG